VVTELFEVAGDQLDLSVGFGPDPERYIGQFNAASGALTIPAIYNHINSAPGGSELPLVESWTDPIQILIYVEVTSGHFIDELTAGAVEVWLRDSPLAE
jgi:hypothetical protein